MEVKMKIATLLISFLFLILLIPPFAYGAGSYYVRTDGHDTNCNGSVNVPDSAETRPNCAFLTISKSESVAAAGDTINIAAGDYLEQVTINVSGTSENRITFVGTGKVAIKQIKLVGADYITLNNLYIGDGTLTTQYAFLLDINQTSDYAIVTGCTIDAYHTVGVYGVYLAGSHNTITGSTIKNFKQTDAVVMGYWGTNMSLCSSYNTLTLSTLIDFEDSDAVILYFGDHITISYNDIGDSVETSNDVTHVDFFQTWTDNPACGTTNLLVEGNYIHDGNHQLAYSNNITDQTSDEWVWRNNVFYNIGMAWRCYGGHAVTNVKFYNNTFHKVGYMYCMPPYNYNQYPCTGYRSYNTQALELCSQMTGEIYNNVFIECGDLTGLYYSDLTTVGWYNGGTFSKDYNYAGRDSTGSYAGKNTSFTNGEAHEVNGGDTKFTNGTTHDYTLQSNSPLKDVGATIVSFSTDKNGITRPQGSAWDIGAYEYANAAPPDTIPPAAPSGVTIS